MEAFFFLKSSVLRHGKVGPNENLFIFLYKSSYTRGFCTFGAR